MNRPTASLRFGAAILAAAVLAACDEGPAITHYVLALSWQPAFCEFNAEKPECRALDPNDFAATRLTVHGLWPNDRPNAGPTYCGIDEATEALDMRKSWCELPRPEISGMVRRELAVRMPGVRSCLDRHEWIKHGSCAGTDAESYFVDTLSLAAQLHATSLGQLVASHVGQDIERRRLIDAFEAAFGAGTGKALTLLCEAGGYLSEIRIALKPTALDGQLGGDDLYFDGPPPRGSCPRIVRIDPAG